MNMTEILATFASEPLFGASVKFLKHLGVKASTETEEPIPFLDLYEESAKDAGAEVPKPILKLFSRVEQTYFIGAVDDDTLAGKQDAVDFKAEPGQRTGMFVFAVQMKDGETLTRSEASILTRGINRVVRQQPATVLILEDTSLSVATCERTPYKQAWRPGEKLGKVSILKGVNCLAPHRGHIDILESMNVKSCKTFDALYAQWQKVFSTSILTNKFYNELFDWYIWALDPKTDVYFPNDPDDDNDDYEDRDTKIIRLITRVMFVWFIKVKGLVPDRLFEAEFLSTILKDFKPTDSTSGTYYNAILQNLFFATLNRAIEDEDGKRRFAEEVGHVDAKNLYRYEELFTITKDQVIELFAEIPFVNGSLFECLDKTKGNDGVSKAYYGDGFSRNDHRIPSTNHYRYRAFVPNDLFFDSEKGLFSIFNRYNFTIEENTPLEQQVALDPELLGKVFENLLGVFNPETQETARKQSGSFYTPREIVDYMVDQTLISYLGDTPLVRKLFSEEFEYKEIDWAEYQTIAAKLKTVKVLDPACGSGAFPVGMLNRIVEILLKLRTEGNNTFKLKRHIIENCIYGGDIQCIAAQITKLRFFISLIVNCEKDLEKPNFGIPELPNLETKFVAANSLISVKADAQRTLWDDPEVDRLKEELRQVRHDHFNARTARQKRSLVKKDAKLRQQLSDRLNGSFFQPKDAQQLADWNPYDQNTSAGFFDPEWMFGIRKGFDIVIGNPPYIQLQANGGMLAGLYEDKGFETFDRMGDIYCLFYERGHKLLSENGVLCYITSDKWMRNSYGEKIREYFVRKTDCRRLVDFTDQQIFDAATVETNILLMARDSVGKCAPRCSSIKERPTMDLAALVVQKESVCEFVGNESWVLRSPIEQSIQRKVQETGKPLAEWNIEMYRGITTGFNEAFIITPDQSRSILSSDKSATSVLKPVLRGRDVSRFGFKWAGYNALTLFPAKHLNIDDYPSVKSFLLGFGMEKLEQTGKTHIVDGEKVKSRKKTPNQWFETQDSISYWPEMDKPKIVWGEISDVPKFAFDQGGEYYCEATTFFMVGEHLPFVYLFLNSKFCEYYFAQIGTTTGMGTLRWKKYKIQELRLPTQYDSAKVDDLVARMLAAKKENADASAIEDEVNDMVYGLYGLTEEEVKVVEANVK